MEKGANEQSIRPIGRLTKALSKGLGVLLLCVECMLFFGVSEAVAQNSPWYKQIGSESSTYYGKMNDYYFSAVFQGYPEVVPNTTSAKIIAEDYVYDSTLSGLQQAGIEDISPVIYKGCTPSSIDHDNMYFYFVSYRPNHAEEFKKEGAVEGVNAYMSLLKSRCGDHFTTGIYPFFDEQTSKEIDHYFRDSSYKAGADLYESIKSGYQAILSQASSDFRSNHIEYGKASAEYSRVRTGYTTIRYVQTFVSYALAIAFHFLLMPLCWKKGRTTNMKLVSTSYLDKTSESPRKSKITLKALVSLFELPAGMFFGLWLFYGQSGISFLNRTFFGIFSLVGIVWTSVIVLVCDLVFMTFNKKHQTFGEFACSLIEVDVNGKERP